jgi:hypothetical protein
LPAGLAAAAFFAGFAGFFVLAAPAFFAGGAALFFFVGFLVFAMGGMLAAPQVYFTHAVPRGS